jgi:hypothetical protein
VILIRDIGTNGCAGWKDYSGHYRRSLDENVTFWLKQLGDSLNSRTL